MTTFRSGDIVAVEFPFSDLQGRKRRPGLVLMSADEDVLVARLTTHAPRDASDIALKYWAEIGLPVASTVRLTKLATMDHRLVHHKIGRLSPDDGREVAKALQQMTNAIADELANA